MKITCNFLLAFFILTHSFSFLNAQNTEGKDFWLTFGKNMGNDYLSVDLYIRIVGGSEPTQGEIYFNELGISDHFNILAYEVYTLKLNPTQKQAIYNTTTGKSNKSIRITSKKLVSVYVMNQRYGITDATNIFPVTTLGIDYYQISYTPAGYGMNEGFAVIATEDNTTVTYNGAPLTTLNTGELYYMVSATDMTGKRITSDKPVAFFVLPQGNNIPVGYCCADLLMQQLAPVNTWGKNFFVPVSHLAKDRVRIVASVDGTNITQIGGTLVSSSGSQMNLTNLQAGQFVELEILLSNMGCRITSNYPVGVCTYLTAAQYNGFGVSDPAQSWLSSLEQSVPRTLIAPFKPEGSTLITDHLALIITETATKNDTKVSEGGATPVSLIGGTWIDHPEAKMSFYNMPLSSSSQSYLFSNSKGLIVLCYGVGEAESYYYLAGSAVRDLTAAFYLNDFHYLELPETFSCTKEVNFRAEIDGLHTASGSLKWFINGLEEEDARDQLTWNKTFTKGVYEIEMLVRFENDVITSYKCTITIEGLWIKIKNVKY